MQAQSRHGSPPPFDNDDEAVLSEDNLKRERGGQDYYQPPYSTYDRFGHGLVPAGYVGEQLYDGSNEVPSQMLQNPAYEAAHDTTNRAAYGYMPAPMQASQPHVPSQNPHFSVPLSRGPHDNTGQSCPPGGRPRVSTTIWEDEGTLCFQVEAKQVTVARREDNNMINGTKLLNVAQMSRGKRDGILKNEAERKVIKVGSMHLKGVWIPFDRALELSNKYYVTDMLYPLFVKDIKKFLYHPANYARTTAVLAAANHRQAQQNQLNGEANLDERSVLERSMSMPTPLDRPVSMLTPPSSASTNGHDWAAASSGSIPLSDTHGRTHSLPGTPVTTPPAPGYFVPGAQSHQQTYMGSFTEPRLSMSGNRYGQQPDMQRSYQHSRNTSMMSYQEEDMSNESSSHSLPPDSFPGMPSNHQQMPIMQMNEQMRISQQNAYRIHNHERHPSYNGEPQRPNSGNASLSNSNGNSSESRLNPATPGHNRGHLRSHSKSSIKVFNTPNLTTQMNRRPLRTPNGSPRRTHSRQASRESANQSNLASLWVQQQQQQQQQHQQQIMYNTPQQGPRGHSRQMSGALPHIFEETPSCRMAYQLHGPGRLADQYPNFGEAEVYAGSNRSPVRQQYPTEQVASPLTGKKKRDRVVSDPDQYYSNQSMPRYEERQESITPPPIVHRDDYEESPKRRRSERTGMHSRSGSVF